jgi:hypothetical protein
MANRVVTGALGAVLVVGGCVQEYEINGKLVPEGAGAAAAGPDQDTGGAGPGSVAQRPERPETQASDGPGGQLPAPFVGDPEGHGRFVVFEQSVAVSGPAGAMDATIYAPSADGAAPAAGGPFPLVVVMPGFTASHPMYAAFSRHLATWGLVVLGIDFTADAEHEQCARETVAAIDWALGADSPVASVLDRERIAAAGHSLGGKIAFFAAVLDHRISVVIGWDPVDSGGPPCFIDPNGCNRWSIAPNSFSGDRGRMDELNAAVLIFGAPPSIFSPAEHNAERFWEGTRHPGLFVRFPRGGHLNWPNGNPEQRITKRTQVAWLMRHLVGHSDLERFFSGEVMRTDMESGAVEVRATTATP